MDGSKTKMDARLRRLSLIDVSSEDDSLIDSSSGNPPEQHSSEVDDTANNLEVKDKITNPTEIMETKGTKISSKYNLRKSLAWDSAFFTSDGVLEPEELSCIIKGVEKGVKHALPSIQEDVTKSCESVSTLESDSFAVEHIGADVQCESISTIGSDNLTIESLEADFFEDIRSSLQKSCTKSTSGSGKSKAIPRIKDSHIAHSLKKVDTASLNKLKPALKNSSATMRVAGKSTKSNPNCTRVPKTAFVGRGKAPLLEQLKAPGKPISSATMPFKRASREMHAKMEDTTNQVTGRVSIVSKAPALGSSRSTVPKSMLPFKPALGLPGSTRTKLATNSSLSSSTSSDKVKSPLNTRRRKVDVGSSKLLSSGSVAKSPSRIASSAKPQPGNSRPSASLLPAIRLSASTSPASSLSEWSVESSSPSISMVKQKINSSSHMFDTHSRKISSDSDTLQVSDCEEHTTDQCLEGPEVVKGLPILCAKSNSGVTGASALMKPSGLRLPSPKIGFFDGARTPCGGVQSNRVLPGGLAKIGTGSFSPGGGQNKMKIGKLQPMRSVTTMKGTKTDNKQNLSSVKPKHPSLPQVSSSEAQNDIPVKIGAGHLKAEDVVTEGCDISMQDSGLNSSETLETLCASRDKLSQGIRVRMQSEDVRSTSIDRENTTHNSCSTSMVEDMSLQREKEHSKDGQLHFLKLDDTVTDRIDVGIHDLNTQSDVVCDVLAVKAIGGNETGKHDLLLSSAQNSGIIGSSMDKLSSKISGSSHSEDMRANSSYGEHNTSASSSNFTLKRESSQKEEEDSKYDQFSPLKAEDIVGGGCHVGMCDSSQGSAQKDGAINITDKISLDSQSSMCLKGNGAANSDGECDIGVSTFYNAEKLNHTIQVDELTRQITMLDINIQAQETNDESLTQSDSKMKFQDNLDSTGFSYEESLDCGQKEKDLDASLVPALSQSPATIDVTACTRTPFAVRDSFCNMNGGSFSASTGATIANSKPVTSTPEESILKEN